jgi:hypothetical protein
MGTLFLGLGELTGEVLRFGKLICSGEDGEPERIPPEGVREWCVGTRGELTERKTGVPLDTTRGLDGSRAVVEGGLVDIRKGEDGRAVELGGEVPM